MSKELPQIIEDKINYQSQKVEKAHEETYLLIKAWFILLFLCFLFYFLSSF